MSQLYLGCRISHYFLTYVIHASQSALTVTLKRCNPPSKVNTVVQPENSSFANISKGIAKWPIPPVLPFLELAF